MSRGIRCLTVWLGVTAAVVVLASALRGEVVAAVTGSWAGLPFDAVLVRGTAVVAAGSGAWLWLVTSVTTWEAARGHQRVPEGGGGVVRRLVLSACGVALVSGAMTGPAGAATPEHPGDDRSVSVQGRLLAGLPLPDRASIPADREHRRSSSPPVAVPPAVRPAGHAVQDAGSTVVVRPGDSLWSIAADTLPTGADPAAVDHRWRQIYAANRAAVGADPDHVEPGLRLLLPPS